MRPIKFRAWDKRSKQLLPIHVIDFDSNKINIYGRENSIESVVLMQYTGLKDNNGVEVYFNDIVEDEYGHRYEVVFEGDCLRCNGIRRIRGGHKPKNRWFGIDLKIVGNRYENPELVKEQNK